MLYSWATKEYLLWEMSLGQVIMYYNLGMESKYPELKNKDTEVYNKYAKAKEELKAMGIVSDQDKAKDDKKAELEKQYGNIG